MKTLLTFIILLTTFIILLTTFSIVSANSRLPLPVKVDSDNAYSMLKDIVNIGPRPSGSINAARTVNYIVNKAKVWGYDATIDIWEAPTPIGIIQFKNIIFSLPGKSKKFIILASHYDTKLLSDSPNFVGANDGGSSTALLLEIMHTLNASQNRFNYSIHFVFFDGEECFKQYTKNDGLYGSKRLAKQLTQLNSLQNCKAVIILDMIGDENLCLTIPLNSDKKLANAVFNIAKKTGNQSKVKWFNGHILDDHVPFHNIGIPSIDLIDLSYGPNNSYWHTSNDTIDKISKQSLQFTGNLTIDLLKQIL